jgi:hypothetical protein
MKGMLLSGLYANSIMPLSIKCCILCYIIPTLLNVLLGKGTRIY